MTKVHGTASALAFGRSCLLFLHPLRQCWFHLRKHKQCETGNCSLPAQGCSGDQMTAMLIPSPSPPEYNQNFRTPAIWARDEGLMAVWAVTETSVTSRWRFYCNEQHLYAFVSLSGWFFTNSGTLFGHSAKVCWIVCWFKKTLEGK